MHSHEHRHHRGGGFWAMRHGGRGHGPGGGPGSEGRGFGRGGRGFGDPDMPRGRKLSSAELQLASLSLLAEKPRHGYELIKAFEDLSNGFYSPSPGMIYPTLTYLEEVGFATVTLDGTRKLYAIAEAGQTHLDQNRAQADALLASLEKIGKRMDEVRRAFAGEASGDDAESLGGEPGLREAFHKARHRLRQAIGDRRGCPPDQARQIIAVLNRAAEEIEGL